ncbi:MAG: putative nuclease with RNAse H fold [Vicingaceae bacterium]|jgi:predicted nuclease with RNAse H fold
MIIGIDFGAKMAGTTVIARMYDHNKVDFFASAKNQDADQFIKDFIESNEDVWLAYLDAPLSLPKVYSQEGTDGNYFYREADQATGAMSPMFLGGLTARAMKLSVELTKLGVKVVETYPSKLAEVLKLKDKNYKKDRHQIAALCEELKEVSGFLFDNEQVETWHHFDSLLCLYSAKRHEIQAAMVFGNIEEGTITV